MNKQYFIIGRITEGKVFGVYFAGYIILSVILAFISYVLEEPILTTTTAILTAYSFISFSYISTYKLATEMEGAVLGLTVASALISSLVSLLILAALS